MGFFSKIKKAVKKVFGGASSQPNQSFPTAGSLPNQTSVPPNQSFPKPGTLPNQTKAPLVDLPDIGNTPTSTKPNQSFASNQSRGANQSFDPNQSFANQSVPLSNENARFPFLRTPQSTALTPEQKKIEDSKAAADRIEAKLKEKALFDAQSPRGLSNVADVLKIAVNPFSSGQIVGNTGNPTVNNLLSNLAESPYLTASFGAGGFTVAGSVLSRFGINIVRGRSKTAVAKAAKIGRTSVETFVTKRNLQTGEITHFVTNTVTQRQTASWLSKLAMGTKGDPTLKVGMLMSAIGSYPFAMFIKEEALQTLDFAVKTAFANDDMEGVQTAIAQIDETLDPSFTDKIIMGIPIINTVKELLDFFEASRIKVDINKQMFEDRLYQLEHGETDNEKYARIAAQQAEEDRAVIDYYNDERKITFDYEQADKKAAADLERVQRGEFNATKRALDIVARNEDAAFWAAERAKQREREAEDRKAIADFWAAYRKQVYENQLENSPSRLNFGLL